MIVPDFSQFRHRFSVPWIVTDTLTFTDSTPLDFIARTADWPDARAGDRITVTGSALNNGSFYVDSTSGDNLFMRAGTVLVNETISATITGWHIDRDGREEWPLANVRKSASGFGNNGSTLTGFPASWSTGTMQITCNALAADATKNVDEFEWYLSQSSDDSTKQFLSITQKVNTATQSFSGSVDIAMTALGTARFSVLTEPRTLRELFRNAHLYVQRLSDDAIQWVDLFEAMTGGLVQ